LALVTAAIVSALLAGAASTTDPVGLWQTPVDNGLIRIERCGADICGRPAGSSRLRAMPDQRDVLNKDPALRGRLIRDIVIFRLQPIGPGRWGKGAIYNPKDGQSYQAELTVKSPAEVHLRGCVVFPLCQTQTWTRSE